MWWRKPILPAAILALAVGGCGFHPLYSRSANSTQVDKRLSAVHVTPIDERKGQILYTALLQRFHSEESQSGPQYRLQVAIEENMTGINYQKNATASGGEMQLVVRWQLLNYQTGQRAANGQFTANDSVNYLGPRYASVAAERDTERQALENMADLITDRIAVFLDTHPQ